MAQLGQKAHGFKYLDFLMVLGFASVVFGFIGGREMVFPVRDAKTQREAQRTHFEGGWRVHYAASGGSASGSGCGNTRRGSPLGRKRLAISRAKSGTFF